MIFYVFEMLYTFSRTMSGALVGVTGYWYNVVDRSTKAHLLCWVTCWRMRLGLQSRASTNFWT